jgi:hypothetical protein
MALIATPRASDANSYITVAEADDLAANRLNTTAWDDSLELEAALIQATSILDQQDYIGITADEYLETEEPIQALKWPRVLNDSGDPIRNYGGTKQAETATIAGTITGDGDASITITAAGMTGSPKTLLVPVLNGDSASMVAGKIRTAFNADADITAMFTVGGSGTAIILTRIVADDNDATLNIAYTNGTCTGLTPNATSANTVAGALYAIPAPIKQATFEVALWLLQTGGSGISVSAGDVESLKIGNSVEVKYAAAATAATEVNDTSTDDTGLPVQAARFLKGLRLIPVLA